MFPPSLDTKCILAADLKEYPCTIGILDFQPIPAITSECDLYFSSRFLDKVLPIKSCRGSTSNCPMDPAKRAIRVGDVVVGRTRSGASAKGM